MSSVDAGGAGVQQVLDALQAASFEDRGKSNQVAVHEVERGPRGVADTGLCGQVDHAVERVPPHEAEQAGMVGDVDLIACHPDRRQQRRDARSLDGGAVVGIEVVAGDDDVSVICEPGRKVGADEAGTAGYQDLHAESLRHGLAACVDYPGCVSVVVPVKDEADNIPPLIEEIHATLKGVAEFEVVYVDDGSTDATVALLDEAS